MASAYDASAQYRVDVEPIRLAGILTAWRWRVVDLRNRSNVVDEDLAHRDADAWSEAWAIVALLLSRNDSRLEGGYSIGVTQY